MSHLRLFVFCITYLFTFACFFDARSQDVDDINSAALLKVEHYLNNIQTMYAAISEEKKGDIYTGFMTISKPGKLRLDYKEPERSLLIIKSDNLTHYNYDLDEASYSKEIPDLIKLLISDQIRLKNFGVSSVQEKDGKIVARFDKFANGNENNAIILFFNANPVALRYVHRVKHDGSVVVYIFENIKINTPVEDNQFYFNREQEKAKLKIN